MWSHGTVLGDRYTLGEQLGSGAMGEVWRAADRVLDREVAIKILLPRHLEEAAFAARFRREAKTLAALTHPGIVDVYDYGEESHAGSGTGFAYIVMELVDGRTLAEVHQERGVLPVGEALEIVAQALEALHVAHQGKIVHRDVKPSNLMLRADGRVAVTDFGIASTASGTGLTAARQVLGTALYMAPEQAEGAGALPASDLYAMGVLCYELLTGEPPFTGASAIEVALKHIREPVPQLPSSFPGPVRDFVARALAKEPGQRHANAAVMAAVARRSAAGQGDLSAALPPTRPLPRDGEGGKGRGRTPGRRRTLLAVVPVVIVSTGAVVYLETLPGARASQGDGSAKRPSASAGAEPGHASSSASASPSAASSSPSASTAGAQDRPAAKPGGHGDPARQSSTPTAGTAAETEAGRPAGCGGDQWGPIVNVGSGRALGLAGDRPRAGGVVVTGGSTSHGWVVRVGGYPGGSTGITSCSAEGFSLEDQRATPHSVGVLSNEHTIGQSWDLVDAGAGTYSIKPFVNDSCLTDTGANKQVITDVCRTGDKSQMWRLPTPG
ncbi:serine/threonine protein kinase [Streptomyces sp. NPDC127574]|uniref:serine/threonine protein kinase n=1 Tax=Streptomyces sp. NPDC127574 TaxID=3345401 RepID=UPI003636CD92